MANQIIMMSSNYSPIEVQWERQEVAKLSVSPTELNNDLLLPRHPKDFKKHVVLGEGAFGQVWLVTNNRTSSNKRPRPFALKIQAKYELLFEGHVGAAVRETKIMEELQHPFISRLYKTYQDSTFLYSVLEFIQGGELFSIMHTQTEGNIKLPEPQVKFYALAIADALAYMHRRNIVYRDLKPENIMIDENGYPVIIDFGFAKKLVEKTYSFCGTSCYLAPEVIMSAGHDGSADHWALGILIYEMLMGENPFYDESLDTTLLFNQRIFFNSIVEDQHEPPVDVSEEAADIIDELLTKDPAMRLGSSDILEHAWFDSCDLQAMRQRQLAAPWIPQIKGRLDSSCFDDWSELVDKTSHSFPRISESDEKEFEEF
jgi:protein kinase A